jgi:CPA1 family monovalent cation:H+ antiporter
MVFLQWVVVVLGGAVVLAGLAQRLGAPYPAFLAVGGAILTLVPGGPHLALEPDLALTLFVAPVLLDAAFGSSLRDLRDNWAPLTNLVVLAVVLTTASVAAVARAVRPEMSLWVAIALGAVVAPPDGTAATAVLRQVRLPHRLTVVLEGESLLNDAMALLIYRLAVSTATSPEPSAGRTVGLGLLAVGGSIGAGVAMGSIYPWLIARATDVPSTIALQFVGTFGVWILADRAHLSSVLTLFTYAVWIARRGPPVSPRLRVQSFAVWDTVVFVLNALAFVVVGLEVRPILEHLSPGQRARDFGFAAAVLGTVVIGRFAWVMTINAIMRWRLRRYGPRTPRPTSPPTVRTGLVVSWCGMRGIVTLAAALALPTGFPQRDLLVLTSFAVVVGTLLLQGLTLRPLVRRLDLCDDHLVTHEIRLAWRRGLESALASFEGDASPEAQALRREYTRAIERAGDGQTRLALPSDALRRRAVAAARVTLAELRARGDIGDDAFRAIEEELDRVELSVDHADAA